MTHPHDPIEIALSEDIGPGDVTSRFFVPGDCTGLAKMIAREKAVLAGVETAADVFTRVDPSLHVTRLGRSGASVLPKDSVLEVRGAIRSILTAERVALNFIQRLSGIATKTRQFVDAVAGTGARILDTRKTTPGLRHLEKAAVLAGGGHNHRNGLFDMVLVKDNHLAAETNLPALQDNINCVRAQHPGMRVEFEADTLDQVRAFLKLEGLDVILLDNMSPDEMREAVAIGKGRVQFEASGGVTPETIRSIAETGVDFISAGALTHSARAIDFSLELVRNDA